MSLNNVRFFDFNVWDPATIEVSSGETNFPGENTSKRWKQVPWRTTGITGEYIRMAGGSSIQCAGFFVFHHNVSVSGTVAIKGSDDNWSTTPFSEVMARSEDSFVYIPGSPVTYDNYGIWIDDATNGDGYIEIGRIWMGEYYAPSHGYSPEYGETIIDPSVTTTSTGGQVSVIEYPKYDTWDLHFDAITDKARYDAMINRVGASREFVMQKKPKGHKPTGYPDPEANSRYVHLSRHRESPVNGNIWSASMKIQEER